jgi:hypothetical protein
MASSSGVPGSCPWRYSGEEHGSHALAASPTMKRWTVPVKRCQFPQALAFMGVSLPSARFLESTPMEMGDWCLAALMVV